MNNLSWNPSIYIQYVYTYTFPLTDPEAMYNGDGAPCRGTADGVRLEDVDGRLTETKDGLVEDEEHIGISDGWTMYGVTGGKRFACLDRVNFT